MIRYGPLLSRYHCPQLLENAFLSVLRISFRKGVLIFKELVLLRRKSCWMIFDHF